MEDIEDDPEEDGDFFQIQKPTAQPNNQREVIKAALQLDAQAKADLELQKRLKMMEEIEGDPEKGDEFNRIVKPSDLKNDEAEAMAFM